MMPAIQIEGLTRRVGDFTLGPLDLTVPTGAVLAFIGPNGAGKTTTLDLMMGLGSPDAGQIKMLGLPLPRDEVAIKQRTAYVNPDLNFGPWGKVGKALDFVSGFYPDWDGARCDALLDKFGLKRSERIGALSFGARIKLSLITALARQAELLLLDEPTVGLDVSARLALLDEIARFATLPGRTVVISSHQLSDLERLASHVAVLHQGRLATMGTMADLIGRYRRLRVSLPATAPFAAQPGLRLLSRQGDTAELLLDRAQATGAIIPGVLEDSAMTLEDIFLALVGRDTP